MVFIPNNVPSSKNSKIKGMFFSKTVQNYLRAFGIQSFSSRRKVVVGYKTIPMTFPVEELKQLFNNVNYPTIIGFHFVRDSKRTFDFNNATQILMDLFTAFDIIEDDNMNYVIPQCLWIDNKHFSYDKENAGVFIDIILRDEKAT